MIELMTGLRTVGKALQELNRMDLYGQVLDSQRQALEIIEQNHTLAKKVHELESRLSEMDETREIRKSLVHQRNTYWQRLPSDAWDGPYCTHCWDADAKLIRLHGASKISWPCPRCGNEVPRVAPPAAGGPTSGPQAGEMQIT